MAKNIDRVLRILDAAAALIQIEAAWNAGKGGPGSQAAKRELKAGYEDWRPYVSRPLYLANNNLDADNDGTACEVSGR